MTSNELIDKWGNDTSFKVSAGLDSDGNYIYTISSSERLKIDEFSSDFENYFNSYINSEVVAEINGGNLYPLKFRAFTKEPIEYSIKSGLSSILRSYESEESMLGEKLKALLANEDLWKEYSEAEREFETIDSGDKDVKSIVAKVDQNPFISGSEVEKHTVYNRITRLNDIEISIRTGVLTNNIKNYIEGQELIVLGVLKKKGSKTVETIETPAIGNWNTIIEADGASTFVELKREDIIKDLKDSIEPLLGEEYHSYSISEIGNNIVVETTPFDKEPFDVEIKSNNIEIVG